MTLRKIILYSLITPALTLIFIVLLALNSNQSYETQEILFGFVLLLIVWVIGVLPALILSRIFKNPKYEPRFYLGTQLVIITAVIVLLLITRFSNNKEISNHEHNIDFIKPVDVQGVTNRRAPLMLALQELESNFPDSNSFRLTSYHSKMEDTVLKGVQQLYDVVYYTYQLKPDQPEMLARIIISEKTAKTDFFNVQAGKHKEYLAEKRRARRLLDSTIKEVSLMADSLSKLSPQKP